MISEPKAPSDVEAEQAILGAILLEPTALHAIDISPADYFVERHGMIHRAMLDVAHSGLHLDYLTLVGRLEDTRTIDAIGGAGYITSLLNRVPTAAHIDAYAERVKQAAKRRALLKLSGQIAADAYNPASDLDTAAAGWMRELLRNATGRAQTKRIGEYALELECEIDDAIANPQDIYGITTGFPDWDKITYGLQRGESTQLCGQPGMGKSMLVAQAALNMGLAGSGVVLYELEMRGVAVVRRLLSGLTDILTHKIRSGYISQDERQFIRETLGRISDLPIFMSDATSWTTTSLRADLTRRVAEDGVLCAVIDHDGLLKDKAESRIAKEGLIGQALHELAKDLNIAVIGVHTMNKTGLRAEMPGIADSSGSVDSVYAADNVCFLTEHKPQDREQPRDNLRTLTYPKAREGEKDRYCHFIVKETRDARGVLRGLPRFETVTQDGGY